MRPGRRRGARRFVAHGIAREHAQHRIQLVVGDARQELEGAGVVRVQLAREAVQQRIPRVGGHALDDQLLPRHA